MNRRLEGSMSAVWRRRIFVLVLVSAVLMALCACKEQTPPYSADDYPQGQTRQLSVTLARPQGSLANLSQSSSILIAFSQPMVSLGTKSVASKDCQPEIQPDVAGQWQWQGTATLKFTPKKGLPGSTNYSVTVPTTLQSLSGQHLAQPYTFTFSTVAPALMASIPYDQAEEIPYDAAAFLAFNQPVDPYVVAKSIKLEVNGKPREFEVRSVTDAETKQLELYDGDLSYQRDGHLESERCLAVQPIQPYPLGAKVVVTVKAGCQATAASNVSSAKDTAVHFEVLREFAFDSVDLQDGYADDWLVLNFSSPVSSEELAKHLHFSPAIKIPDYIATDTTDTACLYWELPLQPYTSYTVTADRELTDKLGRKLGQDVTYSFESKGYSPLVGLSSGTAVMETSAPGLPVVIRNVDDMQLHLANLSSEQAIALLKTSEYLYDDHNTKASADWIVDSVWSPTGLVEDQTNFVNLSLEQVLAGKKSGLVLVDLGYKLRGEPCRSRLFVQVTDIGLTGKFSAENSLIFATSLSSGKPLAGVAVQLRNVDNECLWSGITDNSGIAKAPGWGQYQDSPALYAVATYGSDTAIVDSEGESNIGSWRLGVDKDWGQNRHSCTASVFTERGLYKPGEQVHLKGLVRQQHQGLWVVPKSVSAVTLEVRDSDGNIVYTGKQPLGAMASFDTTIKLSESAASGSYWAAVQLGEQSLGNCSFRVEVYKPNQFEVLTELDKPSLIAGDCFEGKITGRYLYGGVMGGDKYHYSASLAASAFEPKEFADYDFSNEGDFGLADTDKDASDTNIITQGDGQLDKLGTAATSVTIPVDAVKRPSELTYEASVSSVGRQSISSRQVCQVLPSSCVLGVKVKEFLVEAGQPLDFDFVAVDGQAQPVAGVSTTVTLVNRQWDSVRKANGMGSYEWVTNTHDTEISTTKVTSAKGPTSCTVLPPSAGYYYIKLSSTDSRGRSAVCSTSFFAVGGGYVPWARFDDDTLELASDKAEYAIGDVAKVMIPSPYERAQALVTVERSGILSHWVKEVVGSTPVVEIPVLANYGPNVYVSVVLISGRTASGKYNSEGYDLGKPSFRIGYAKLKVDVSSHKLKVSVITDKKDYRPGEQVTAQVHITDSKGQPVSGEVCLAAVDEGVLSLIDYKTPNFFDDYYAEKPLGVDTSETRTSVIGQRGSSQKGANQGGGGGSAVGNYRNDFSTTAFWSPRLKVDAQGQAKVSFVLPDSLTRYRLMAVALTADSKFGSGSENITVSKPLMMLPSIPRYARVGDKFEAGVIVRNNTNKVMMVEVASEASGISVTSRGQEQLQLASQKDTLVPFSIDCSQAGDFDIKFVARAGSYEDKLQVALPVYNDEARDILATSGQLTGSLGHEAVTVPGGARPGSATLQATVASSLVAGIDGAYAQLLDTEEYNAEIVICKIKAILDKACWDNGTKQTNQIPAQTIKQVNVLLEKLEQSRCGNGYGLFPGFRFKSPQVTAQALQTLVKAKQCGCQVDGDRIRQCASSLFNTGDAQIVEFSTKEQVSNTMRAYVLWALAQAKWNQGLDSRFNALYAAGSDITPQGSVFLLNAAVLMGKTEAIPRLRQQVLNCLKVHGRTATFEYGESGYWRWSRDYFQATALEALLNSGSFEQADKVVRSIVDGRKHGSWGDSLVNAVTIGALIKYNQVFETASPNMFATIRLDGRPVVKAELDKSLRMASGTLKIAEIGQSLSLDVAKNGAGTLFYDCMLRYVRKDDAPAQDRGFLILAKLFDIDGKRQVEGPLTAGKVYLLKAAVLSPQARHQVLVDIPLPAGCEVVQTLFDTERQEYAELLKKANSVSDGPNYVYGGFDYMRQQENSAVMYADSLEAGEYEHCMLVRASYPGTYRQPAAYVSELVRPEIFGNSKVNTIEIKP